MLPLVCVILATALPVCAEQRVPEPQVATHPMDALTADEIKASAGILREAGIPLHEALYDGDEPAWMAATTRPDLFLHEEWAVTIAGDTVATAIQRASRKTGPRYHLVQTVKVKGAPVIEIYQRD